MLELCRKKSMARNLSKMCKMFPDHYDFMPRTFSLPIDMQVCVCMCMCEVLSPRDLVITWYYWNFTLCASMLAKECAIALAAYLPSM
jgi:hypothetical protein